MKRILVWTVAFFFCCVTWGLFILLCLEGGK